MIYRGFCENTSGRLSVATRLDHLEVALDVETVARWDSLFGHYLFRNRAVVSVDLAIRLRRKAFFSRPEDGLRAGWARTLFAVDAGESALAFDLRRITEEIGIVVGSRSVAGLTLARSALTVLVAFVTRRTLT